MPNIETKMRLSRDGQWFITQTIITEIKSINFINKVLENKPREESVR